HARGPTIGPWRMIRGEKASLSAPRTRRARHRQDWRFAPCSISRPREAPKILNCSVALRLLRGKAWLASLLARPTTNKVADARLPSNQRAHDPRIGDAWIRAGNRGT